jgi:hypothetical protein
MHSETSNREENKEAMVDTKFHDTSSSAVNEEVLLDNGRNCDDDDDDCTASEDANRNNELMYSETSK